jgi:hypothetical protein
VRPLVHRNRAARADHGDGICPRRKAALHAEWFPRAGLFVLGDAIAVFAWVALDGHVENSRLHAQRVQHHEAHGATNSGVGSVTRSKEVHAAVKAELAAHGSTHDRQLPSATGAGVANVERRRPPALVCPALDGRHHDRKIFGPTASHHGVGRRVFDRALHVRFGNGDQHFIWVAADSVDEFLHHLRPRWDDGQAVSPAFFEVAFDGIECIDGLDGLTGHSVMSILSNGVGPAKSDPSGE